MSTPGTIRFRYQVESEDDQDFEVSADEINDSLIITGGVNDQMLVRDDTQPDGWGWTDATSLVGPEGPAGPHGPAGPQGIPGPVSDPLVTSTLKGGSAASSTLTLQPTSHASPDGTSAIIFKITDGAGTGSAGKEVLRIQSDRRIVLDSTSYFSYRKIDNSIVDGWSLDGLTNAQISFLMPLKVGSVTLITDSAVKSNDGFFSRYIGKENNSLITVPSNGSFVLNNWNENDFDRLVFGGSISSTAHPALKRSGTELQVKLANDSAFADFRCRNIAFGVNNVYMTGRNAAGNADVNMLKINASNEIDVGVKMNAGLLTCNGLTMVGSSGISGSLTGTIAAGAQGWLGLSTRAYFTSPSTGVLTLLDGAATNFGRMQFGGTTAAFPAIKRSGAGLEVRAADDSAAAPLTVATVGVTEGVVPGTTTGVATLYVESGALKIKFGDGTIKTVTLT